MADPYAYPGTNVLINKENIRNAGELARFERIMTAKRMVLGSPQVSMNVDGYRQMHRHLFQDVYEWAGKLRTVNIGKGNPDFCKVQFVATELDKRFGLLRSENNLKGLKPEQFAGRAAEHLSELNAIHPFREGNGRTMRSFLVCLGRQAGHQIELQQINPERWNEASKYSFRTADPTPFRQIIQTAIVERTREQDKDRSQDTSHEHGRSR